MRTPVAQRPENTGVSSKVSLLAGASRFASDFKNTQQALLNNDSTLNAAENSRDPVGVIVQGP